MHRAQHRAHPVKLSTVVGACAALLLGGEVRANDGPADVNAAPTTPAPWDAGEAADAAAAPDADETRDDARGDAPAAPVSGPTSAPGPAAAPAPGGERRAAQAKVGQVSENTAGAAAPPPSLATDIDVDYGQAEIIEIVRRTPPGSAHAIDAEDLERFEHDDVHKILAAVPGVYIREEDGYGLRPNIGMRGTGSERSAKIALMEDDVLIAPAPYSAPAAYYFPLVTRMHRVEVVKGPSAVKHGPNTVGGAINLLSRPIPDDRTVTVDVAGGGDLYGKLHASYGDSTEHFGWLVEGAGLHSDGFKDLDGGGDTGFAKRDVLVKLRANTDPDAAINHRLELKLGYGDETSDETYTGLSDADFAANPYRRYAATRLDLMEWDHRQAQLTYEGRFAGRVRLVGRLYRNEFSRDWRKLNGFATSRTLSEILAAPDAGNNAVFHAVLTGQADSSSAAETLLVGTNARDFVSQGAQLAAGMERYWLDWTHTMELGTRLHYDEADRHHSADGYLMMDGALVATGADTLVDTDALGSTLAWASHYHHTAQRGPWKLTAGVRGEWIATEHRDRLDPDAASDGSYAVLIPGGGVVYQPWERLGLLAGVHRGFVPVSPGQGDEVSPEESINYEAGLRYGDRHLAVETIGFFSDYQNLLGTCTFSTGCADDQVGEEFDGGRVWAYGAEVSANAEPALTDALKLPVRLAYTFQRAEFRTAFSSSNPQWGDVTVGDRLPYLPEHSVHLEVGISASAWEASVAGRHTSAMRDAAGQGEMETPGAEAATVIDLAGAYSFGAWGKVYGTVNNLLDEAHIASRRPYGARPGIPRLFIVGYKNQF